jgi:hypothetical protein
MQTIHHADTEESHSELHMMATMLYRLMSPYDLPIEGLA